MDWTQLKEGDEEFIDVVSRLKEEGDPRGYLLPLQDSIKRTLIQLRDEIRAQGRGTGASQKSRHEPDDLTDATDRQWKERSKERPIPGEERKRTEQDYQELKQQTSRQTSSTKSRMPTRSSS